MQTDRRISFEGISNARDLGGLVTADGRKVRSGFLIRSANLSAATASDIRKLREDYHLSLVLDLRTNMARKMKPDVLIEGVENRHILIFDDTLIGITHENDRDYARRKTPMPDLSKLYKAMVTMDMCRERFGQILTLIMEHDFEKGSVLIHCSEGKDRAGIITAFLLSALGVDRRQIMEDYLITNEVNVEKAESYYRSVLENGADREVAESVKNAFLAKEEYLQGAFESIDSNWTDFDTYLTQGLGVRQETAEVFRRKILCDDGMCGV